jgi:hypothetical protein
VFALLVIFHRCLSQRQLRATPDTKEHPGIVTLAVNGSTDFFLVRCRNYASAYSAAWLAPAHYVYKTRYNDRVTLEWHSHNLYHTFSGGSYKIEPPHTTS